MKEGDKHWQTQDVSGAGAKIVKGHLLYAVGHQHEKSHRTCNWVLSTRKGDPRGQYPMFCPMKRHNKGALYHVLSIGRHHRRRFIMLYLP